MSTWSVTATRSKPGENVTRHRERGRGPQEVAQGRGHRRWMRLKEAQRIIKELIGERQGLGCLYCGYRPPGGLSGLEIEHLRWGDDGPKAADLALACTKCQRIQGGKRSRKRTKIARSPVSEYSVVTKAVEQRADLRYEEGPSSMAANNVLEPKWKAKVLETIRDQGFIGRQDATAGLAEYLDCSAATTQRYLDKASSPKWGWLERRVGEHRQIEFIYRNGGA